MKILFYVEPHPIRESLTNHGWIASEFIDMLEDEFINKKYFVENSQVRLSVSRSINSVIKKNKNKEVYEKFLIGLTQEENDYIEKTLLKPWNSESIKEWQSLMNGEGLISSFYEELLGRIYTTVFDFDVMVYWGTNGAVRNFSKNYNIPAIAMELGCTRKPIFDSLYFDFLGVNGSAYTNHVKLNKIMDLYSFDEVKSFLPFSLVYGQQRDGLYSPIKSKYSEEIYANNGKNILIPLQLADDANILQYSKYNSMFHFLNEVVPLLIEQGYTCFIKPHPGNVHRQYNRDDHEKSELYCESIEKAIWLDDIDNNIDYATLIMKMECVVVVNSSVGFESMLLGKLVVPLGESPYNLSDKLPTLNDFLEHKINVEEYNILIQKIIKLLLFHYLHFKDRGFSFIEFKQALIYNIKLRELWLEDHEKFEMFIINNSINGLEDYFSFPIKKRPLKKQPMIKAVSKVTIVEKLTFWKKTKKVLKKIPFLGILLKKTYKFLFR